MHKLIKKDERWDDLVLDGLGVIQEIGGYGFTSDSVLLANYIKAGAKDSCVELCAGSGVISVIMGHKKRPKNLLLVEIQDEQVDRARRTFEINNMQAKILCSKFQGIHKTIGEGTFDVVYANPPYRENKLDSSEKKSVAISTHEIEMNLAELILEAERLLKFGGRFYIVYTAYRLSELIYELKKNKLEPKNMTLVFPKDGKNAELVLLTATKGGKPNMVVTPSIYQKDKDGNDTAMMRAIYNSKN